MSNCTIAPAFSFSSSTHENEKPDLESMRVLVVSINQYIISFLENAKIRNSVYMNCTSRLKIEKREFFEFSEQSVFSNLYWGIENIEAAIQENYLQERESWLRNAERMLQVPALLDEHGGTAGISNSYLVCCSYFYLSVIRKLQQDEWQVALHFLQALLVYPRLVRTEFAPELCQSLFPMCVMSERQESSGTSALGSTSLVEFGNDEVGETMGQMARRYKDWLIYYQVILYGETPQWHLGCRVTSAPADETQYTTKGILTSSESSNRIEQRDDEQTYHKFEKVHPLDSQENTTDDLAAEPHGCTKSPKLQDNSETLRILDQVPEFRVNNQEIKRTSKLKCLQDILNDSESDMSTSADFHEIMDATESSPVIAKLHADDQEPENSDQKLQTPCFMPDPLCRAMSLSYAPRHPMHKEGSEVNFTKFFSGRYPSSIIDLDLSISEISDKRTHSCWNHVDNEKTRWKLQEVQLFHHIASTSKQNYRSIQTEHQKTAPRKSKNFPGHKRLNRVCLHRDKDSQSEIQEVLDKTISKLCFSEGSEKCHDDCFAEVKIIYEMLNHKAGVRYEVLKDTFLDQLLTAISTSKEEEIVRASVSILTTIISENKSVIEDIKTKGLQLGDMATALKRNVYEAATLIYLINPSPSEIKKLEVLPTLVEVVCTSNSYNNRLAASLQLTPPTASLMIIEVLVTAFDYDTNNMHLAAINSPRVLCALVQVAKQDNLEEFISLATIFVKCMQFDGQCRKYISEFTPVGPFIDLLQSNKRRPKIIALEFFHEILRMPRSSAISLLQRMQNKGSINIVDILIQSVQQLEPDYQLLAANLILQLEGLEDSSSRIMFIDEAIHVLLKSVASEESPPTQLLSAFILANLGGTYAWTGEPYTVAWLVKKAGLTSLTHRNMIRNFDWLDQSLQDTETDLWCTKIAKSIIHVRNPVFHALAKGLKSKIKRISIDSLTAIAWLGCEIRKSPNSLKYSACEILLSGIEQFLHPGLELEERLLACLCIYNYTSGKGMQKIIHFSEGVRESLRRFSNVIWMAEELHKVADYILPNKSRISCVHTQILEASHNRSGAVNALIYYKGLLYSGYSDGSIKVWDVKRQSAILVSSIKEHKKVIATKDPIQKLDTYGHMIFVKTQGHSMKVFDSSRRLKDICKSKKVKCMGMFQGKIYAGCSDSSIQELGTTNNREREIKGPAKSWIMQKRPINSIVIYKDWLYSASSIVEGSNIKEWRRHSEPQLSIRAEKRTNVLTMGVVEDVIYLNCSSTPSILQIWLTGAGQRVGRLSAGSKITSLLTANDIILCGTDTGLIKGCIPL